MKRLVLHPFLYTIFPILFLYAQNATETNFTEILYPLLLASVTAALILLAFKPLLGNFTKSSLLVTFLAFAFFSFGHLTALLRDAEYFGASANVSGFLILALIIIAALIFFVYLRKTKKKFGGLTQFLNVTAIILVLIQMGMVFKVQLNRREQPSRIDNLDSSIFVPEVLPDIYYLIFDGYGREDILREIYQYDNSSFISELKRRGFYIADSSHSNYCATVQSLSSSLNLHYLHFLGKFNPHWFDRTPLAKMLAENRVFNFLKRFDYKIVAFESGHSPTQIEKADYYYKPGVTLSEFQNILINTTPVSLLLSQTKSQFDIHRDRISYILDKIGNLEKIREPKMVFAHLISPHPPFVFSENGESIERDWPFTFADGDHYTIQGGTIEEYRIGYRNQLKYISGRILSLIDQILYNSVNPPIIIIQGDHGPGSGLYWEDLQKTDLRERFSILNAYYLPDLTSDS
ncbi:MAG: hypothetical protein JSW07_09665, partial [bacterium]